VVRKELRAGLIGFGAVGAPVARGILEGLAGNCRLVAVLVREKSLAGARDALPAGILVTDRPQEFLGQAPDLVIETAGHEALRAYGPAVLAAGADLVTISAGALANDAFRTELVAAALANDTRILIPSGAIAGLDGVSAAALSPQTTVTHLTRKPPAAWRGTAAEQQIDVDQLAEPVTLLEGTARQSAAAYPSNVNVQAAVALAGIGLDSTRVQVIADPFVTGNVHEITARGEFGEMTVTVRGVPTPGNARTGRLTAFAVLRTVRNLTAPLVIGV
jgi:aspartate dehydrogenase